ncbi:MAG: glutathione S-transferase family protein [Roseinatronobacter sp.]
MKLYACHGSGNCFKPWLVLVQLELDHEITFIDVLKGEQHGDAFRAINPLGVVPWLITHDGHGIGESNAMLWYLAEGSKLMPQSRADRATALQWMFFEQTRLEPFISPARFFTTILPQERNSRASDIEKWQISARPGLTRLEAHLANRDFMLSSGYSIADIAIFGYVHVMGEAGIDTADYPMIERWIERVSNTPNFRPLRDLGQRFRDVA